MTFLRKEGRYWYVYWYAAGKKHSRSTRTTNKILAEKIRRKIEDDLAAEKFNINHVDSNILLSDFSKEALLYSHTNKSERTFDIDDKAFNHFLKFCGNVPLGKIKPRLIEAFKLHAKEKLNPTTINMYLRHLSSGFSLAVKYGYLNDNPFKAVRKLPVDEPLPRFLTRDQAKKLLEKGEGYSIYQFIMLGLYTGARISEICELKWEDVFLEQGKIRLYGKGRKERIIPIPQKLILYLAAREKEAIASKEGYVIKGSRNRRKASRKFTAHIERCKLPKFRFHDLRHTYASWLSMKGKSIQQIQKALGHKNIKTTMVYAQLSPENLNGLVDDFD